MKYNWIIFDADGTLFDYNAAELFAITNTFNHFSINIPKNVISSYRDINEFLFKSFENGKITLNKLKTERFSLLFQKLAVSVDVNAFSKIYLENLSLGGQLLPDAEYVVSELFEKINMIILTNGIASVQRPRLEHSSIKPFFKELIISEEEGYAKPSSDIFDVAFERMNHPTLDEVLIVGDSLTSDIAGGKNYGIDTCWLCPELISGNKSLATYEISKLTELFEVLKKI